MKIYVWSGSGCLNGRIYGNCSTRQKLEKLNKHNERKGPPPPPTGISISMIIFNLRILKLRVLYVGSDSADQISNLLVRVLGLELLILINNRSAD